MRQYSKMNKGYKYIFTNIDVFSKVAYTFPLKSKKYKIVNPVSKEYLKIISQNLFGVIKNQLFSVKKCNSFTKITTLNISYQLSFKSSRYRKI